MLVTQEALFAFLDDEGLSYPTGQTRKSWIFTCPRCHKPKKLYAYKDGGGFRCFSCGDNFKGRLTYLLSVMAGMAIDEVKDRLGLSDDVPMSSRIDVELRDPNQIGPQDEEEEIEYPVCEWPDHTVPFDHPHAARGVSYLEGRGIPASVAIEYQIRYSPRERRVYFPVTVGGALVGYQARLVVDGQGVKVLSSPDIPRGHVLMFQDRLRGTGHAVLTEGLVDALKAHLCGGNVASMGKMVSEGQIDVLRRNKVKRLYLGLDPDAEEEAGRLIRRLTGEFEVFQVRPLPGRKDLGEMTFEEVRTAFDAAEPAVPGRIYVFLGGLDT